MKIALAQLNFTVGKIEDNAAKIIHYINQAEKKKVDIIFFPELALTGYPPDDCYFDRSFQQRISEALQKLQKACKHIAVILGSPYFHTDQPETRKPFNAALLIGGEGIRKTKFKNHLPNYDIFNESRYFSKALKESANPWNLYNTNIDLNICEDLWQQGKEVKTFFSNKVSAIKKADAIFNISCSPFTHFKDQQRKNLLHHLSKKYTLPIFYLNGVGAQADIIFDGGSMVYNHQGVLLDQFPFFHEAIRYYELKEKKVSFSKSTPINQNSCWEDKTLQAIIFGIREYFAKSTMQKAVIGISGGLDSALVCYLVQKAIGTENIISIFLPSSFTSQTSYQCVKQLEEKLAIKILNFHLQQQLNTTLSVLKKHIEKKANVVAENLQARLRMIYLMAFSNASAGMLINTSNKSELAMGYGTLYGDLAGGISPIGDLYKTEVFKLAKFINRKEAIIPQSIIERAPTAELRVGQKDTDSLPPYDILDPILYGLIEAQEQKNYFKDKDILPSLIESVKQQVKNMEYKRKSFCPIIKVSEKSFGRGSVFEQL